MFKNPVPGSSNYLNAYDSNGVLIRSKFARRDEGEDGDAEAPQRESNGDKKSAPPAGQDLMPYPNNTNFKSEAVLSEELRNMIYAEVTERGSTVRETSEKYKVDMRRVGAVIRLKSVEKDWVDKVSI